MSTAAIPPEYLARARGITLTLPASVEQETWDHPTFRVGKKIFAAMGTGDGVTTMSMKAAPGEQESLLAGGHPFFHPSYVGSKGWIGIVIDEATDWDEVAELVTDSYIQIAPRTLARQVEETLG